VIAVAIFLCRFQTTVLSRFIFHPLHHLQNSPEIIAFLFSLMLGLSQSLSGDIPLPIQTYQALCFSRDSRSLHGIARPVPFLSGLCSTTGSKERVICLVANFPAFSNITWPSNHSSIKTYPVAFRFHSPPTTSAK
jgi:hypothetical protein